MLGSGMRFDGAGHYLQLNDQKAIAQMEPYV